MNYHSLALKYYVSECKDGRGLSQTRFPAVPVPSCSKTNGIATDKGQGGAAESSSSGGSSGRSTPGGPSKRIPLDPPISLATTLDDHIHESVYKIVATLEAGGSATDEESSSARGEHASSGSGGGTVLLLAPPLRLLVYAESSESKE